MKNILSAIFLIGLTFVFNFNAVNAVSNTSIENEKQITSAKRNYEQIKEDFRISTENYKNTRNNFLQKRVEYKERKGNIDKNELKEKSAEFLNKTILVMIKYLESFTNRIENMTFISEEDKSKITLRLESDINSLNEKLTEIKNADTLEEQKELATEIRQLWKDIRSTSKRITGQVLSAKMNTFISKMETASNELQEKSEGVDNETIQEIIANYDSKVVLTKGSIELAKIKFDEIDNKESANELFKEGIQHLKEAHKYIKEAHKEFLNLSKEIRNITEDGETEEGDDDEDSEKEIENSEEDSEIKTSDTVPDMTE